MIAHAGSRPVIEPDTVERDTDSMPSNRILTWQSYLSEALPGCLAGAGVGREQMTTIVDDVARRARDYAARRALRVPFIDDVAGFLPREAPAAVKADVAVVVRNSLLENAHARGPVEDGDLTRITVLATGALNEWLYENSNKDEHAPPCGMFAAAADHSRAYPALRALAAAAERGGRRSFRMPRPGVPDRPAGAPAVRDTARVRVVRSGLDALDDDLLARLDAVADGSSPLGFCSSLSRYSRDTRLLCQVLDVVLAHGGSLLTTNFLIRPGEVFSRRPPFVAACSYDPVSVLTPDRMPGLAAKYTRIVIEQAGDPSPRPEM